METTIRQVTDADKAMLLDMMLAFNLELDYFDPCFQVDSSAARKYFAGYLEKTLADRQTAYFFAFCDEVPAGLLEIAARRSAAVMGGVSYGHISSLYVSPRYRHSGVGRRLAEAALAWFGERGLDMVQLHVLADNEAAVAFWRKMGFDDYMLRLHRRLAPTE